MIDHPANRLRPSESEAPTRTWLCTENPLWVQARSLSRSPSEIAPALQVELFWVGLFFNVAGIAYVGTKLFKASKEHAQCIA